MRLLGITRAELVEEVIQDQWGGQLDNFCTDLSINGCIIHLCTREVKIGAKQVDGTILEGDAKDVARKFLGRHEANISQTKECGEAVLLPSVVCQLAMTLGQFDVILDAQGSRVTRLAKSRFNWTQTDWICFLRQSETCLS